MAGDFDILPKIFVKNHSPGTTDFVKKHKNPHPRAGELCQMFLPRGNAIHSRHPPRPNQTTNCTSLRDLSEISWGGGGWNQGEGYIFFSSQKGEGQIKLRALKGEGKKKTCQFFI